MILETILIFPLPFTGDPFPFSTETKAGETNLSRLEKFINLFDIRLVAPESIIQRSCKLSSSNAVIKAVRNLV
jgi:hypothetical protein